MQISLKLDTVPMERTEVENDGGAVKEHDRPFGIGDTLRLVSVKSRWCQARRGKTGKLSVVFNDKEPHRPTISG